MTNIQKIADQLTTVRKAAGLSQTALAHKLGMKQSQISDIEAGKHDIRVGTLIEVARAIGLEMVLVPRSLLPAVSYVVQPGKTASVNEQQAMYETWTEDENEEVH